MTALQPGKQVSALHSHWQRSCLMQRMGTNTETYLQADSMQRVRDLGTLSPKWDSSIKSLPLDRKPCVRGSRKSVSTRGRGEQQVSKTIEVNMIIAHQKSERLRCHAQVLPKYVLDPQQIHHTSRWVFLMEFLSEEYKRSLILVSSLELFYLC